MPVKLLRFPHSCYAWKVQALLELGKVPFAVVDVPYGDRSLLLAAVPGYTSVPVLVLEDGSAVADSRAIAAHLVERHPGCRGLVPAGLEAAAWAYADWAEGGLEDVLFRLATPGIRDRFASANDRALFVLVKERKFGPGAVAAWERDRAGLRARAAALLVPTGQTLARQPFLLGPRPTLADAALYGQMAMAVYGGADPAQLGGPPLVAWAERMRAEGASPFPGR